MIKKEQNDEVNFIMSKIKKPTLAVPGACPAPSPAGTDWGLLGVLFPPFPPLPLPFPPTGGRLSHFDCTQVSTLGSAHDCAISTGL